MLKSAYLLRKKYEEIVTIYTSASNRKLKTCIKLSFILVLFINILNYDFYIFSFIVCFSDFIILFNVLIMLVFFMFQYNIFSLTLVQFYFCNFSTLTPIYFRLLPSFKSIY